MKYRTKQGLRTLRRAHQFLSTGKFSASIGELTPHIEALGALVQQLQAHSTEQGRRDQEARAATDDKRAKGEMLRKEFLRPIAAIATSLFANEPTIRSGFRIPRGRDDEGLLQVAESFIEQAAQYEAQFVARGLASDFVQRVRVATAAFRDAIDARGRTVGRRVAATAGMHDTMLKARELVRLIDLMLSPRLVQQPDQLAEWRSLARFVRRAAEVEDEGEEDDLGSVGSGSGGTPGTGAAITPVTPIATPITPPSGGRAPEVKAA